MTDKPINLETYRFKREFAQSVDQFNGLRDKLSEAINGWAKDKANDYHLQSLAIDALASTMVDLGGFARTNGKSLLKRLCVEIHNRRVDWEEEFHDWFIKDVPETDINDYDLEHQ
jgi:hypothetical protein